MINKRKKKYNNTDKRVFDTKYSSSFNSMSVGVMDTDMDSGSSSMEGFDPRTLGGELKPLADGQLNDLQTSANERRDAEESNLDILDRGSRYTRKSDKLKKFKETNRG